MCGSQRRVWVCVDHSCPLFRMHSHCLPKGFLLCWFLNIHIRDIPSVICLIISFRLGVLNLGAMGPYRIHKLVSGDHEPTEIGCKFGAYLHIWIFLGKGSIVSIRFPEEIWESKDRLGTTAVRSKERFVFITPTGKCFKCPITPTKASDTFGRNKISCQILHRKQGQNCSFVKSLQRGYLKTLTKFHLCLSRIVKHFPSTCSRYL